MITVDRDFFTKLEESLKKLAKQNERIKQAVKDREEFERQVIKLKQKVRLLKQDKSDLFQERENLMQ
jgi:DNA replication initiation complex subunit (GINS family)